MLWKTLYSSSNKLDTQKLKPIEKPEYQINDFQSKSFNDTGDIKTTVKAENLSYFTQSKLSKLIQPRIKLHSNNQSSEPTWQLKADKASSIQPNNHVSLDSNIEMVRMASPESKHELKIYSQEMDLLLKEEVASSKGAVTILSEQSQIRGLGFKSDLHKNYVVLKSNVKSEYVTNAQTDDPANRLYIESDTFLLEGNGGKLTHEGKVILIQEGITIRADRVEVFKVNEQQTAFAYGNPATFDQVPSTDNAAIYAEAKRFEFNSQEEKLKIYQDARLMQGEAILEGGFLYYDTQTENIGAESQPLSTLQANTDSQANKEPETKQRVKMILPRKNKP